jgi:hemerythrin
MWTDDLSVGVKDIDQQHQELFKRINMLMDAMWEGKGKDEVGNLMNFLAEYVVVHFADEEALMESSEYPGLEGHRKIHQDFVRSIDGTKKRFDEDEVNTDFVVGVLDETCRWLREHIGKTDKLIGEHMSGR